MPALAPSRRRLLQSLGLLGGAMVLPAATAAPSVSPRRILFYVSSHGTVHDQWVVRGGHGDDEAYQLDLGRLRREEFSPILGPLWPYREQLLVLEGIGNAAAASAGFFTHLAAQGSVQTGRVPINGPAGLVCDGPSLDQELAALQDTPFPSLELSTGGTASAVSYDPLGLPLPYETDPARLFARLFSRTGTGPAADLVRDRQTDVLRFVAGRYDPLIARLPREERDKLALHRDLVRDLEVRSQALLAIDCPAPAEPAEVPPPDDALWPDVLVGGFLDLAAVAFSCDLTRVVTVRVDRIPTATVGAPPGDLHTDIAHYVAVDPAAEAFMVEHHRWHARQLARLLDTLDAIPEDDGTLLDHTLVVWHNELATGDHLLHCVPYVIAGGGSALRTGRYHRWTEVTPIGSFSGEQAIGRPHNQVLATLATAMGHPVDRYGATEVADVHGDPVDLTGVLPGVLR